MDSSDRRRLYTVLGLIPTAPAAGPRVNRYGYTDEQMEWQRQAADNPNVTIDAFRAQQTEFLAGNAVAQPPPRDQASAKEWLQLLQDTAWRLVLTAGPVVVLIILAFLAPH